ncbi:MAG: hypothetical protein OEN02_12075 [Gammaproteobacteria bacterium]|nr:hypothetical protein [Gammaproteobacteria bacterium]MDH3538059.1 hypothetical protein [Gammaproteobacteria bacterium]
MESDSARSEQVVEAYKRHKLAVGALRRMRELVHGFEQDRAVDARLARIGVALILVVLATAAWLYISGDSITLP